jgi:hypothetical protein
VITYAPMEDVLAVGLEELLNGSTVPVGFPDPTPTVLDGITAGSRVPAALAGPAVKGFVRVTVLNDVDDGVTRTLTVDTEVFCTSYARGMAIGERIRGILRTETRIAGVVLDRRTTGGPKEVPWDDNNTIRRFLSTHRISTRR